MCKLSCLVREREGAQSGGAALKCTVCTVAPHTFQVQAVALTTHPGSQKGGWSADVYGYIYSHYEMCPIYGLPCSYTI